MARPFPSRLKARASALLRRVPSYHTDWRALVRHDPRAWAAARAGAESGPRILVATSMGGFYAGATDRKSVV